MAAAIQSLITNTHHMIERLSNQVNHIILIWYYVDHNLTSQNTSIDPVFKDCATHHLLINHIAATL